MQQLHEQKRMLVANFEEQLAAAAAEAAKYKSLVDDMLFGRGPGDRARPQPR